MKQTLPASGASGSFGRIDWSGRRRGRVAFSGLGQTKRLTKFHIDSGANIGVVLQELPRGFAALPDAFALVAVPGTALLDGIMCDTQV